MTTRPTPSAATVVIPDWWTPDQALAVFELLNELRDTLWTIHGSQIQDLLQQERGCAARDVQAGEPNSGEPSF